MCKLPTEEGLGAVVMVCLCLHVLYVCISNGIQHRAVIHLMNIHQCDVIDVAQLAAPQTGMDDGIMANSSGIG